MALTRVQGTGRSRTGSAASVALTFPAPPTVGNGIIVLVQTWGGAFPGTCTDNRDNTYTLAVQGNPAISAAMAQIWYCPKVTASGAPFTITVNVGSGVFYTASACEYAGVGGGLSVDKTTAKWGTSLPVTCDPLAALTATADAVLGAVFAVANNEASITVEAASPAWVQEHEDLDNPIFIGGEGDTRLVPSAAGATPGVSWAIPAAGAWQSTLAAFKTSAPVDVLTPELKGKDRAAAIKAIHDAGLTVGSIVSTPDRVIPKDQVIAQSPPASASVPPGTAVNLVISTGPELAGAITMPALSPPITVSAAQVFDTSATPRQSLGSRAASADGRQFVYVKTLAAVTTNTWLQSPPNLARTSGITNVAAFEPMASARIKFRAGGGVLALPANTYAGGLIVDANGTAFRVNSHEAIAPNTDLWVQIADSDRVPRAFAAGQSWVFYAMPFDGLTVAAAAGGPLVGLWQGWSDAPAYGWVQVSGFAIARCTGAIATDAPLVLDLATGNLGAAAADSTSVVLGRALASQASGTAYLPILLGL